MWKRKLKTEQKDLKITSCIYQPLHVSMVTLSHSLAQNFTKANCNIMQTNQFWQARKVKTEKPTMLRNSCDKHVSDYELYVPNVFWNRIVLAGSLCRITSKTTIAAWGTRLPSWLEKSLLKKSSCGTMLRTNAASIYSNNGLIYNARQDAKIR